MEIRTLDPEDGDLVQHLADLKEGDWVRVLGHVSESARDELRAALGQLMGESAMPDEEGR